jgi:hypothetical protein
MPWKWERPLLLQQIILTMSWLRGYPAAVKQCDQKFFFNGKNRNPKCLYFLAKSSTFLLKVVVPKVFFGAYHEWDIFNNRFVKFFVETFPVTLLLATSPACFFARANFRSHCCPGLPDGIFSDQNRNLGNFWRVLQCKLSVYFLDIWSNLR